MLDPRIALLLTQHEEINRDSRLINAAGEGARVCRSLRPIGLTRGIQGDGVTKSLWASAVVRRKAANASISSLLREP
jgi:hypothetical protein